MKRFGYPTLGYGLIERIDGFLALFVPRAVEVKLLSALQLRKLARIEVHGEKS